MFLRYRSSRLTGLFKQHLFTDMLAQNQSSKWIHIYLDLYVAHVQIHETETNSWRLEVKGHAGSVEVFSNKTELHFEPKWPSTFIQTDKPNYLPGQTVRIRVLSVQPDGKPHVSPTDIIIRVSRLETAAAESRGTVCPMLGVRPTDLLC